MSMSKNSTVALASGSHDGDDYLLTFTRVSRTHTWITQRVYRVNKRRFNQCLAIVRRVHESDNRYALLEPSTFEWN